MVDFARRERGEDLYQLIARMEDRRDLEAARAKLLKAVLQIDEKLDGPFPEVTWREYLSGLATLAVGSVALVIAMNFFAYWLQGLF